MLAFMFYTFHWGRAMAGWLFASLNPVFFVNLPSPAEFIDTLYPLSGKPLAYVVGTVSQLVVNVSWTVLTGTSLYMTLTLIREHRVSGD